MIRSYIGRTMDNKNRKMLEFKINKKMWSKGACSSFLKGLSGLSITKNIDSSI